MTQTNRTWLPRYCDPNGFLPKIQETRTLFRWPSFLFEDFVGRAIAFLQSDAARAMGFEYDPARVLPCHWKCSDESVFGVDLWVYAFTGRYPFDKGAIGGHLNEPSLGAAVHHGGINVDFGGSHVGYVPGEGGGEFGRIWRPLEGEWSTDCGYLMSLLEPFRVVYDDACQNILLFGSPAGEVVVSVPNEFIQPNWSGQRIKLLVDLETLAAGPVPYDEEQPSTHTPAGRTLFHVNPGFLDDLPQAQAARFASPEPSPVGSWLTHRYFSIFDTEAELDEHGLPRQRLLLYMKHILSAQNSPPPLKAAIVNTSLEHNRLTDAVRAERFKPYQFASFTGIFVDLYDEVVGNYVNLFQPLGLTVKPRGTARDVELTPEEIHETFERLEPVEPVCPLGITSGASSRAVLDRFTYRPGYFRKGCHGLRSSQP